MGDPADLGVVLLAALLHDIGKGVPGDHSEAGAEIADAWARRAGLLPARRDHLVWLVRRHLLLAETALRRDVSDATTIRRFAEEVADPARLSMLYALSVADARATGPAAWSAAKASLMRTLTDRAERHLRGSRLTDRSGGAETALTSHAALLDRRAAHVEWATTATGEVQCTVVSRDRPRLLADAAGALALVGLDVRTAGAYTRDDGMALEIFVAADPFGRLGDQARTAAATATVFDAISGTTDLAAELDERARRYRAEPTDPAEAEVVLDFGASVGATAVEIHATDEVGLLARIAASLADLGVDVIRALASTVGDRAVDTFYVRDAAGDRPVDFERVRSALLTELRARDAGDDRPRGRRADRPVAPA